MNKYPRIYKMIKAAGHSPVKALKILIRARRGDRHSIEWIKCLFVWRSNLNENN